MRPISRLLIAILLLSCLSPCALGAERILPEREHRDITMEELSAMTFSMEDFQTDCEDLMAAAQDGDREETARLLEKVRDSYLLMDTELTISQLEADRDVTDMDAADRSRERMLQSYRVDDTLREAILTVLDSDCGDLVDQEDMVFYYFTWPDEPMTEQEETLYDEEQRLIDQYYATANRSFTAEVGGKKYDDYDLYDAWLSGAVSDAEYDAGTLEIARAENEALGGYYISLLENRRQQAALYGYEDYSAMQDEYVYYRDYTRGEIETFSQAVRQELVPLAAELQERVSRYVDRGAYGTTFTEEELLTTVPEVLSSISEELLPAWDYMTSHGYYDLEPSSVKSGATYTMPLAYAGAPYLFLSPYGDDTDFGGVIHEFGHCNAFYCASDLYAVNIDLSEIHSQALELLAMEDYDRVFGEDAEAERVYTLYAMLDAIINSCMLDELERYAYGTQNVTLEEINDKYGELLGQYGYRDESETGPGYDWVMTTHLFDQPLYVLSYAVSAAAALDIWSVSLTDRPAAVDTYLRLVAIGEGEDFFRALRQVGMDNPLSQSAVRTLAETVRGQLPGGASGGFSPLVAAAVLVPFAIIILALLLARKRSKRYDETGDGIYGEGPEEPL